MQSNQGIACRTSCIHISITRLHTLQAKEPYSNKHTVAIKSKQKSNN